MRIYDDRYQRERLRFHVALQFIRLEARTRTIRLWTGLSDDRIRKLYRSYIADGVPEPLPRHRGRSPQRIAVFLRSARLRQETALLASLCRLAGALPADRDAGFALALPALQRAALLCRAYDGYRNLIGQPRLAFEHAVFLVHALAQGEELRCDRCHDCHALVVVDRWSLALPRCALCGDEAAATADRALQQPQWRLPSELGRTGAGLAARADALQDSLG